MLSVTSKERVEGRAAEGGERWKNQEEGEKEDEEEGSKWMEKRGRRQGMEGKKWSGR